MQYLYAAAAIVSTAFGAQVVAFIVLQYARISPVPANIPWVNLRGKRWFPKLRATLREYTSGRQPLEEGYEKYCKHDKPFVLPGLHGPEIILPPSNVHWVASQPEHVLSGVTAQDELLGLPYLTHGPNGASVHDFTVIRRDLTRQMGNVLRDVLNEISASLTEGFGVDTEGWQKVKAVTTMFETAQRAVNRVFVGLPLCRDPGYLKATHRWEIFFALSANVLRDLVPNLLKPLIGPMMALPLAAVKWLAVRRILPTIRKRVDKLKAARGSERVVQEADRPNDMLQWIIEAAAQKHNPAELDPWNIAGKAIVLEFFAVHTTSLTASTVLADIVSCPSATSLLCELREEADAILPKLASDPRAIRDMAKMDSVIRESLRLHPMFGHGTTREVVNPGGITTPDGLWLPQGCKVAISVVFPQRDSCETGDEWQPLRFCIDRAVGVAEAKPSVDATAKQTMTVQISDHFMSFGLGRHACPGRFFAVQTLKLMLGYLVMYYDFEPLVERRKFIEIGDVVIPSPKTVLKVRRRRSEQEAESPVG